MDRFAKIPDPVMVICAHEDDAEVHAGGTIRRLVLAGRTITQVLCTSGNRGTDDPAFTMEEVARIRQKEQEAASAVLGVEDLVFLDFDDGDLAYQPRELREQVIRLIRERRPRAVITHDPFPGDGSEDSCSIYPDHLTSGYAAFQAAFVCAPGPLFHPEHLEEGLEPWKPEVLYCIMSARPGFFVDVTEVFEDKWEALRQHRSQGRDRPEVREFFHRIARDLGERAGGLELAEGFRVLLP